MTGAEQVAAAWRWLGWELSAIGRTARSAVRYPGPERDTMVQALKAAGAAIAAWALTGWWLQAPMALMAPWTALVLVDVTVYRSLCSGVQQFAVIVAGTLWASAAMAATGGSTLGAMLIVLPATALLGTYRRFGSNGVYGSTTALFVITYGAYSLTEVGHRLLETLIGAVVGVCVNALVLPPVHLRNARDQLQRLSRDSAGLLDAMAEGLRGEWSGADAAGWHDRARRLDQVLRALADARRWTSESSRFNPGMRLRRSAVPPPPEADAVWERTVGHLTTVTRLLAGTAGEQARLSAPGTEFLTRYADLASRTARLCEADRDLMEQPRPGGEERSRQRTAWKEAWALHDALAADFHRQNGPAAEVSGGLLVETRLMLSALTPREVYEGDDTTPATSGETGA